MGLLITVEGGDYTGKTSVVVPAIKKYFEKKATPVLVSREPGGTKRGEEIRKEIFEKIKHNASPRQLALLFNQARKVHLEEVIIPFLGKNKEKQGVVILDRYLDSTRVYQGMEHGMPIETITELEEIYVDGYLPDGTFILYFPEDIFEQTITERQKNARQHTAWDTQSIADHLRRQQNYLQLPALSKKLGEKRRFFLLDATGGKVHVRKRVEEALDSLEELNNNLKLI